MILPILLVSWRIIETTADKRCIQFCASDNHFYDAMVIWSEEQMSVTECPVTCRTMDECEGFNYDSAAATCHLINSAHNLTAAAGITAWSMKLCAGMYYALKKPGLLIRRVYLLTITVFVS